LSKIASATKRGLVIGTGQKLSASLPKTAVIVGSPLDQAARDPQSDVSGTLREGNDV
jgi:hypothetical protein